ncbi:uncharacterized [Tachysurus ichikawai]
MAMRMRRQQPGAIRRAVRCSAEEKKKCRHCVTPQKLDLFVETLDPLKELLILLELPNAHEPNALIPHSFYLVSRQYYTSD